MAGLFPDLSNGGIVYRDLSGNPTGAAGLSFAYPPAAQFTATCALTALPNNCSARLTPEQINALVSELVCLGEAFVPDGEWRCAVTCNLSRLFQEWVENTIPPGDIASESYVDDRIQSLIGGAPSEMDTLGQLAAAITAIYGDYVTEPEMAAAIAALS